MSGVGKRVKFSPYGHPYIEVGIYELILDKYDELWLLNTRTLTKTSVDELRNNNYFQDINYEDKVDDIVLIEVKRLVENEVKQYLWNHIEDEED